MSCECPPQPGATRGRVRGRVGGARDARPLKRCDVRLSLTDHIIRVRLQRHREVALPVHGWPCLSRAELGGVQPENRLCGGTEKP
jgi:hypothetical protein